MVRFVRGDIFNADVGALVNPVNTVGVMGRGLALQFKKRYPRNYELYRQGCKAGELVVGRVFVTETEEGDCPRYIVNFPTKKHWRSPSRIEYVEAGLEDLATKIRDLSIESIAVPSLGAGLGGLAWPDVRDRIEAALGGLDGVEVAVYEPHE